MIDPTDPLPWDEPGIMESLDEIQELLAEIDGPEKDIIEPDLRTDNDDWWQAQDCDLQYQRETEKETEREHRSEQSEL